MKKLLLTAAAVSFLSSASAYAVEAGFYLKANVGWNMMNGKTLKESSKDPAGKDTTLSLKLKSKSDIHFGLGAGYRIMDNARVDIMFDHYANPSLKASKVLADVMQDAANPPVDYRLDTRVKVKGEVNSLLFNGYFDVYCMDEFKFFVGAGVGVGQVGAKVTTTLGFRDKDGKNEIKEITVQDPNDPTKTIKQGPVSTTVKAKRATTFAFAAHVGVSYEFAPGVTGEVVYSYRDLGKTKKFGGESIQFRGHHATAGVRFDI